MFKWKSPIPFIIFMIVIIIIFVVCYIFGNTTIDGNGISSSLSFTF